MSKGAIAVIGGTGFTNLSGLEVEAREEVATPYGSPSGPLVHGRLNESSVIFLSRHGEPHTIPPHKVNYRANLWALQQSGVETVFAVAAVGSINTAAKPGGLIIPNQIIDYTWGRAHTFFEDDLEDVVHVDFTSPYCTRLRALMITVARELDLGAWEEGTYGAMQGPRLESAAEIDRLERDGCDIVGMTGMPEAALARELGMCYATCAVSANWAAGRSETEITMEAIRQTLQEGMAKVAALLRALLPRL